MAEESKKRTICQAMAIFLNDASLLNHRKVLYLGFLLRRIIGTILTVTRDCLHIKAGSYVR